MYSINCKGKLLVIDEPLVMGIVNATPDSFFEGHLDQGITQITNLVGNMISNGASIIDIGGQSTKPGSKPITATEEIDRVLPVIESIHQVYPETIISIDTYYSKVALAAVNAGASIVNDISAGSIDDDILITVAALKTPYICMHMQGKPATMQQAPHYNDVMKELLDFFIQKIAECKQIGIQDIIIDPGFGFGKTIAHNFKILKQLQILNMLERPILAGISRKSTIYKTLGNTAADALNGTTVLNTVALLNGAAILRVHDVKEAGEAVKLINAYKNA